MKRYALSWLSSAISSGIPSQRFSARSASASRSATVASTSGSGVIPSIIHRFPLLDWLRLALALEVVRCHYFSPHWMLLPCVPAFLGISGLVVLQSFERSKSWGHFAWKRFLRIVPGYSVTLLALAIIGGWSLVKGNLLMYASSGFVVDGFNASTWSLGAEEAAYFALALLYLAGAYKRPWLIAGLAFASVALMIWSDHPGMIQEGLGARFRVQCLPYAFFVGNLFYLLRERLSGRMWEGAILTAVGLAVARFEWTAISSLFVVPGLLLLALSIHPKIVPSRDLSFGIYLWHEIWLHVLPSRWEALAATALSAYLSSVLVEMPALRLKDLGSHLGKTPNRRSVRDAVPDAKGCAA